MQANEQAERLKSMKQKLFVVESDKTTFISQMVNEYQRFANAQGEMLKANEQTAMASESRRQEGLQVQLKSVIEIDQGMKSGQAQLELSTRNTVIQVMQELTPKIIKEVESSGNASQSAVKLREKTFWPSPKRSPGKSNVLKLWRPNPPLSAPLIYLLKEQRNSRAPMVLPL